MKFYLLLIILLPLQLTAQTPPDRTFFYNEQGQKTKVKEKWDEDNNGFKHGKYILYNEDFGYYVSLTGFYTHGKKSGQWIDYYYNKDIHSIGNYSNDLKTGQWKESYNSELKIYQEGNYIDGLRNGKWINCKSGATAIDEYDLTVSSTYKGYSTLYDNGKVKAIFNEMGENILLKLIAENEKEQKEKTEYQNQVKANEQQEAVFNDAMNKYQDNNSYYGDISLLQDYLKKYPNGLFIIEAKEAIKNKPDNDAFYFNNNYLKYEKEYPTGLHITEVKKAIKASVVNDIDNFITTINKKLETGDATKAIELCEMVLRYKDEFHNSQYLPVVIYYSLSLWSNSNQQKAIEVIKPYSSTVINFSSGDRKFMDKYWELYKLYKKPLKIEEDKATYKQIQSL